MHSIFKAIGYRSAGRRVGQKISRLSISILILLAIFSRPDRLLAQSENIRFDRISIEDGLSQSTVFTILQDRQGFMWFGTQDGLNKFDGYQFTIYKNDPEDPTTISDNFTRVVFCGWVPMGVASTSSTAIRKPFPLTSTTRPTPPALAIIMSGHCMKTGPGRCGSVPMGAV